MRTFYSLALVLLAMPVYAQKYEFGVHGGVSLYTPKTISASRGTADVGFKPGYVAGATLGHNMYDRVGGELRYSYLKNDLKLESSGTQAKFGGEAHAIHYDVLIHTADRESKIRPYAAVGAGAKYYRGTGTETAYQPLNNFALLTRTNETKGMISVGGGVKVAISDRVLFRVDVHDYITPFPKEVITPVPGASVGGWIHNLVPTAGFTFLF